MPSSVTSLLELPSEVLKNLLYFLPQELLLNLSLTNFHFYEPCARQLYRSIAVQILPVLRSNTESSDRRRLDFTELSVTTIDGFSSVATTKAAHAKLVVAKINTLINSISINPQLAQYIDLIQVPDGLDSTTADAFLRLIETLYSVDNSVLKIYIADARLRRSLRYHKWCLRFALRSVVVDDLGFLTSPEFQNFKAVEELIIAGVGNHDFLPASLIPMLENLVHLRIRDEPKVWNRVVQALQGLYRKKPFVMKSLISFNVVHTHENHTEGLPFLQPGKLVNFQISLGCDDYEKCDQECFHDSFARFEFHGLKRLAIIQSGNPSNNSHKNSEKWDLVVFSFVKDILEACPLMSYLCIRHNVPLDGVIEDGYEGNYLRKVQLYTLVLPRLLSTVQRHVVNLVLPNLVASLACYEQPMNTFLWNGCKCIHCDGFLEKLDDFLLHHRYYSPEKGVYKDVQTVQLMRTMSEVLTDRIARDANMGDLQCFDRPLQNTSWNFHDNKFSVPFRCLPVKTYDIHDMEDDAQEARDGKERFFDAEDKPNDCSFLKKEQFFPNYLIVVSHYLDDLIRKMINLNRGDAEDADMNRVSYENDGWTNLQINKMLINGIDYNFDREINGTIFYTNSYDDAKSDGLAV